MAITEAISKVGDAVKGIFDYVKERKTKQSETQVIKDKKRLKDASNIAEDIFTITDQYAEIFTAEHLKEYRKLREKFDNKD